MQNLKILLSEEEKEEINELDKLNLVLQEEINEKKKFKIKR